MSNDAEGPFRATFSVSLDGYGRLRGPRNDIEALRARIETILRVRFHDDTITVTLADRSR